MAIEAPQNERFLEKEMEGKKESVLLSVKE